MNFDQIERMIEDCRARRRTSAWSGTLWPDRPRRALVFRVSCPFCRETANDRAFLQSEVVYARSMDTVPVCMQEPTKEDPGLAERRKLTSIASERKWLEEDTEYLESQRSSYLRLPLEFDRTTRSVGLENRDRHECDGEEGVSPLRINVWGGEVH